MEIGKVLRFVELLQERSVCFEFRKICFAADEIENPERSKLNSQYTIQELICLIIDSC